MQQGVKLLLGVNVAVFVIGFFMTQFQTRKILRSMWGEGIISILLGLIVSQLQTESLRKEIRNKVV